MNFLLIPDKFKGSLTSEEVSKAFMAGVAQAGITNTFQYIKASDGGDGFMDAVSHYKRCIAIQVISQNPLGKPQRSHYLYNQESNAAYIEMAKSSGMVLLSEQERNPMLTSTYGTGLEIKDAIEKGVKNIYVGLGGSATNDGGIGIAHALGFDFLDADGNSLAPIGENLSKISSIDDAKTNVLPKDIYFYAINDVTNPLYGDNGAAHVYAAQKGADEGMIEELDAGLQNLDKVIIEQFQKEYANTPGSGAAGGTAYGLKCFLGANYISGIDFILELSGVRQILAKERFDFIVTGEGKIDEQTLNGKLIQGVMRLAKEFELPVLAVCGKLDVPLEELKNKGVQDVLEIQDTSRDLDYNMMNAAKLLTEKTANYLKKM
ncbi:MAG: glycerate kinase [Maribacter sp.]